MFQRFGDLESRACLMQGRLPRMAERDGDQQNPRDGMLSLLADGSTGRGEGGLVDHVVVVIPQP